MLQDIFTVLRPSRHDRIWIRNIFTDPIPTSYNDVCTGNPWEAPPPQASDCSSFAHSPYDTAEVYGAVDHSAIIARKVVIGIALILVGIGSFGLMFSMLFQAVFGGPPASSSAKKVLGNSAKGMVVKTTPVGSGGYRNSRGNRKLSLREQPYIQAAEDSSHCLIRGGAQPQMPSSGHDKDLRDMERDDESIGPSSLMSFSVDPKSGTLVGKPTSGINAIARQSFSPAFKDPPPMPKNQIPVKQPPVFTARSKEQGQLAEERKRQEEKKAAEARWFFGVGTLLQ